MKKIITLFVCLFAGIAVQAQDNFPLQFVDKDGNIIPDGTELDIMDYEEDDLFGDILMPIHVWVKNVSNGEVQGGGTYTIQTIGNGYFQTCFPSYCMRQSKAGTYTTGSEAIMPGQQKDMQTEWLPMDEGTCVVSYQLLTYRKVGNNYLPDGDGPTVTFYFFYGTTGIDSAKTGKKVASVSYYDLKGQETERSLHGIYIKKTAYTDGTSDVQKRLFR